MLNLLEAKLLALVATEGDQPAAIRAALADPALAREVALVVAAFSRMPDHPLVDRMFRDILREAVLDPLFSERLAYIPPQIWRELHRLKAMKAERDALPKDDPRRPPLTQEIYRLHEELNGWTLPNPKGRKPGKPWSTKIKQRAPQL